MKRKIMIGLAVVILAVSMIVIFCACGGNEDSSQQSSQDTISTKGPTFALSGDKKYYIVTGTSTDSRNILTIPKTHEGLPVKHIAPLAFDNCTNLLAVTIPDSIEEIGNEAFYGCTGLTEVVIPDSVTIIGEKAFANCSNIKSLTVGKKVNTILSSAFSNCMSLEKIYFNAVNCSKFNNDNGVFYDAGKQGNGLDVFFGANVEFVPDYLFYPYTGNYLPQINNVVFPENSRCKTIGSNAFAHCESIKTAELPKALIDLGDMAFLGCSSLSKVIVGDEIETLGKSAFDKCPALVTADDEYACYIGNDENPYAVLIKTIDSGISQCIVQEKCKIVYPEAFYGCKNLISVNIPGEVKSVGAYAFYGCERLESINIGKNVQHIGEFAFYGCEHLSELTLPFVGESAAAEGFKAVFGYIFGFSMQATQNVKIEGAVFQYATNLGSAMEQDYYYYIPEKIEKVVINGETKAIGKNAFYNCSGISTLELPDGLKDVGAYAFYDCKGLTVSPLPDSVTTIGKYAFYGCDSLVTMTLPKETLSVGEFAFAECKGLTKVTISDKVTALGIYVFQHCENIHTVTLGENVETVGEGVFAGCRGLAEFNLNSIACKDFSQGNDVFSGAGEDGITLNVGIKTTRIPANMFRPVTGGSIQVKVRGINFAENGVCQSIEENAFRKCLGLSNVLLPNSMRTIGEGAFGECDELTGLDLGGTTDIKKMAFYKCGNLNTIIYGDNLAVIGAYAFFECKALEEITVTEKVVSIGACAFSGCAQVKRLNYNATACADFKEKDDVFAKMGMNAETEVKVYVGASVRSLPAYFLYAYSESNNISFVTEIEFEAGTECKTIGFYAFAACNRLDSIVYPSTKDDWEKIEKNGITTGTTHVYIVHCSDGDIGT